ncbi:MULTISPECIES: cohesin domain-containing protein [unclassified Carboxylicivirga]|uniref:cohesin domain-containing protein n=1 Tax=Carboxylicivirga TaxID=1628153 RepID=UPI003D333FA5
MIKQVNIRDLRYYLFTMSVWLMFFGSVRADIGLRIAHVTGVVGDVVEVPVYVDTSLTSLDVLAFQVAVDYNSSLLEALDPTFDGTMSESWGTPVYNIAQQGRVSFSNAGVIPLSGTGVLAYLHFRLKQAGTAYLNFKVGEETLFNEGSIALYLTNGRVSISPLPYLNFSPNGGVVVVGETLQYNVSHGAAPYSWATTDPSVAVISPSGLITGVSPGLIRVIATDALGVTDTADAYVEVVPFLITIRDTSYYQNNEVVIPVNISLLDDYDVVSGEVSLGYNSSILTADEVLYAGSILEGVSTRSANLSASGVLSVSFASAISLMGDGPLFYIRFRVADRSSGAGWIDVLDALFNESLKAKIDRGYFSIISLPGLNVTPSTAQLLLGQSMDFNVSGGVPPYNWSVSDPSLASINQDGILTALAGGQVMLFVTDPRGSLGQSGTIDLYDGSIDLGNIIVPANENTALLPVYLLSDVAMSPVVSLSGTIDFDDTKILDMAVSNDGTATESWAFSDRLQGDHFQFAGAGVTGVAGDVTMLSLDVTLAEGLPVGQVIPVNLTDMMVNEGRPRLNIISGAIEIGEPTAVNQPGQDGIKVVYLPGIVRVINLPDDCRYISLYAMTGQQIEMVRSEGSQYDFFTNSYKKGIYILKFDGKIDRYVKVRF